MNQNNKRHIRRRLLGLCVFGGSPLMLIGCVAGPKYVRPAVQTPAAYKETGDAWKQVAPSDAVAKGRWWEIYQDPQLNSLEDQVTAANESLKQAQDTFAEARAAIRGVRASYYPVVSAAPAVTGVGQSRNKPTFGGNLHYDDIQLPLEVSYEPDLWNRVRLSVEQAQAQAQASAADVANVALSLQAELAIDYFDLRGMDSQTQLLTSTVASYTQALSLTQSRYTGGLASGVDVAQAQTQLETTRAEAVDVGIQRAADEHAIAVLIGKPASEFAISPLPLGTPPPPVPPGVPSELLERRPDIAAAERIVAAANAQIGIARTAYYPNVSLTGLAGFDSGRITSLLEGPAAFWELAGSAAETLFEGGTRRAALEESRASYNQYVDSYRQTVLTAFREVEDSLSTLRILQEEAQTEDNAVAAAQHYLDLSTSRYRGGVADYLEVTTAQSAALVNQRSAVDILTRRMEESVQLIKAIGGGWDASQLPSIQDMQPGHYPPATQRDPTNPAS